MADITVVNHEERGRQLSMTATGKAADIKTLNLQIGANIVDDAVIAEFRKNEGVAALFKRGVLSVKESPSGEGDFDPEAFKVDLSKLKLREAKKAIAACEDPRQLRKWIDDDGRPEVRGALLARHRELVPNPIDEAENVTDDDSEE